MTQVRIAGAAALMSSLNWNEVTQVPDVGWTVDIATRALRTMLRDARKWAPLETVGPLFMGKAGETLYRVELASPCGPNSEHSQTTSYPNLDYFNRCVRRVWDRHPELWFAGQWHTHPFEDVPQPSPWDIWGANLDRSCGWFSWNEADFNGKGHLEVIMATRMTRAWWITTNPDRIWLVYEVPIGIEAGLPKGESQSRSPLSN